MMRTISWCSLGLLVLSGACANGDGRGFASVDGTLRVTAPDDDFTTAAGDPATLERFTVSVANVSLVESTAGTSVVQTRTAALPVGSSFDPLDGDFALPFGPYEVDRGEFDTLSVSIRRFEAAGDANGAAFTMIYAPSTPLVLSSPAALPVDGERAPNVHLQITVDLPKDLLEGIDPLSESAAEALAARLAAAPEVVKATWKRTGD